MRWSIRNQLLAPLLLLLLGVVSLSVWMALSSARNARQRIETRVRNVARNLSEEWDYPLKRPILMQMKRLSGADYLLIPRNGKPVSTFEVAPRDRPSATVHTDWRKLQLEGSFVVEDRRYLCSAIQLLRPSESGAILYILFPESLLIDARWEAMRPVLILGSTVGLASLLLTLGLGQRLSRRFLDLERRTRAIASGDFGAMPLPPNNDEIRDLTASINEMAAELARLHEATRRSERLRLLGQVSGGLAHQLRNGMAGARLAVQLFLQSCPESLDVIALRKALDQLTLQETHLQRFLHLGRKTECEKKPCSVRESVARTVDLLDAQCCHENITLEPPTTTEPMNILGDAGQLDELFVNIVGNAIEAAGPGGRVSIRLERTADAPNVVAVEVRDSGPGPPEEIRERLFEPFVTGKAEGVGLGLALAARTAEEHGGSIAWRREEAETCFRVELPLLDESEGIS